MTRRLLCACALAASAAACLDFDTALRDYCPRLPDGGAGNCADGGGGTDFSVTFSPSPVTVTAGGTQGVQVNVARGTFQGDIAIAVTPSSLPAQVTATSTTVTAGTSSGTLTFSAQSTAASSSFVATVTAAGDVTKSYSLPVTVTGVGNLTVNISGAPATPTVLVTGPNNYSNTLSGSMTLQGLPAGTYTVTAETLRVTDTLVAALYDAAVTGSGVVPSEGTATVTVQYGQRPGTGHLWVVDYGADALIGFSSGQLHTTYPRDAGAITADVQIGIDPTTMPIPYQPAFDSTGDLWLAIPNTVTTNTPMIYHYGREQIGMSGSVAPKGRVQIPGASPESIAFDHNGNLWVGDGFFTNALYELTPASIADAGYFSSDGGIPIVTPAVKIQADAGGLNLYNTFIAFDSAGDLYATRCDFDTSGYPVAASSRLFKFTPSQLQSSGTKTPAASIYVTDNYADGGLANPQGLAFDANGNLWVSNYGWDNGGNSPQVVKILGPALQSASGLTTVPDATHIYSTDFYGPAGVALDESGGLWISNVAVATVVHFPAGAVAVGGYLNLTPDNIVPGQVTTGFQDFVEIVFAPSAPGLPLAY